MAHDSYPLSPMQQGMLFNSLYAPGSGVDLEQIVCLLHEPIHAAALEQAWQRVVQRHAVLKTSFHWQEGDPPRQQVHTHVQFPFELLDWRDAGTPEQQARLEARLQADRRRGFDFDQAPLMRLALIRLAETEHILLWSFHHILMDGRSFPVVIKQVFAFYEALCQGQAVVSEPPRPYRDYIEWLQHQDATRAQAFWQNLLDGFTTPTRLMEDQARASTDRMPADMAMQAINLAPELTASLQSLAERHQLTLNTLVQGAWALLLSRYGGEQDIVFGATRACRRSALNGDGTEAMVGVFINTLPVRARVLPNMPLLDWLKELRAQSLAVREYEHTPLAQVQAWSQIPGGTPLFESILVFENYSLDSILQAQGGAWARREFKLLEQTNYALTLSVYGGTALVLRLGYDRRRFSDAAIERMLGHVRTLLTGMAAAPHQRLADVPLLTPAESQQLLVDWNDTRADYPATLCAHQLWEAQVEQTPHAIAVIGEGQRLTCGELNRRANQLARVLRKLGAGPETLVGIYMERTLEMIVGLLGVWKAGAAYVPMDVAYPHERLAFMLQDARVSIVLAQPSLRHTLSDIGQHIICLDPTWQTIAAEDDANLPSQAASDNLAYVIYTSGSTGQPKGALITHRGLVNYLVWCIEAYQVRQGNGAPVHSSIGFDLTVTSLYAPLLAGRTITLVPEREGIEALGNAVRQAQDWSLVKLTPAHLDILSQQVPPATASGRTRYFIIGGEALRSEQLAFWQTHAPGTKLINEYGPTETVVGCCVYAAPTGTWAAGTIPIGRPIANTQLYVLDRHLRPAPIGVPGELYIGGEGVARGYLGRPDLTAERFVPNPFGAEPGARLYRTGDLARYLPDGNLEFLGRLDHQVKVRGFRVELGEIETVLGQHPAVQEVVVVDREDVPGQKRLVAYAVAKPAQTLAAADLRRFVQDKLPDYMTPAAFMLLTAMPLTTNGKIDRRALPAPELAPSKLAQSYAPPRTAVEQTLAEIWAGVLHLERVSIHDSFFELGGDSILSFQIIARARQRGIQLAPRQIFQYQTIAELSGVVSTPLAAVAEQGPVTGPAPLTPIQRWFLEMDLPDVHHWNMAMLCEAREALDPMRLQAAVQHLTHHHDALRLRFEQDSPSGAWRQVIAAPDEPVAVTWRDFSALTDDEQRAAVAAEAARLQTSLNLSRGPLVQVALFNLGPARPSRLLIIVHHLAMDGISWRILLEDLQTAYRQLTPGQAAQLPVKTTSFKQWAWQLAEYAQTPAVRQEAPYWLAPIASRALPTDWADGGSNTVASARTVSVSLGVEETRALVQDVPPVYRTHINDVLLTAAAQALAAWTGSNDVLLDVEGHGREDILPEADLTRTAGWFTSIFPVRLKVEAQQPGAALKSIKEQLRRIPRHGIGYGLLRYLSADAETAAGLRALPQAQVSFNYLGQFDAVTGENPLVQPVPDAGLFRVTSESIGATRSLRGRRAHVLEIVGGIADNQLHLDWIYSEQIHRRATIEHIARDFIAKLRAIISHCQSPMAGGYTPSDFPEAGLDQAQLDSLLEELGGLDLQTT